MKCEMLPDPLSVCVCLCLCTLQRKRNHHPSSMRKLEVFELAFAIIIAKKEKKIPRNWWFVVVLNPDLFISINPKTFAEKRLECTLRKTLIRKINYMTNTWNMKCFFATIHCLSIQMHPFLRCSNFLPELKVYKQLVFYKALRPFGYRLS